LIEDHASLAHLPASADPRLAFVGLTASTAGPDVALDVIRAFKQVGCPVIAFGDGTDSWPLGVRCRGLLAGARCVLNSRAKTFAHDCRQVLLEASNAAVKAREDDETVKAAMRQFGIVGETRQMVAVFRAVLKASMPSDLPVLITGETGTGKELIAHAIHSLDSKRKDGPFLPFNSSAIMPTLAESELFGHRRGAFTGADRERKGLFRAAHGGVLFLDEIGELDPILQAKLLRVLEDYRVMAVGDDEGVSVNVRIVAATNRDLNEMVRQSRFRADLLHRLKVLSIHIPPLRERRDDIRPLIDHFLRKHEGLRPPGRLAAGHDFVEALTRVELPGNARQLENLLRQVLLDKNDDFPLNLADLPEEIWRQLSEKTEEPAARAGHEEPAGETEANHVIRPDDLMLRLTTLLKSNSWNLSRSLKECERVLIQAALHAAHNNQTQTARLLGITARSVYNKIHEHSLRP